MMDNGRKEKFIKRCGKCGCMTKNGAAIKSGIGNIIEFAKVSDEKETVKVKVMVCSCMKRLPICIAIFRFPFLTVKDGRWRKCWRRPIPLYRRYGAAMESVSHPYPVARE
jgi:hypothetical protein